MNNMITIENMITISWRVIQCAALACVAGAASAAPGNLITNGDFQNGRLGGLPDGWSLRAARPELAPVFKLAKEDAQQMLLATGGGNPDCVGFLTTKAPITLGKTYLFQVTFRVSADLNPQEHLLFQCFGNNAANGIFEFKRLGDGWVEGSSKIKYFGEGESKADVRIVFRLSARGKAWVKNISLAETDPVPPRWVKVACTKGAMNADSMPGVLDAAGKAGVDLVLLTEYSRGGLHPETVPGPSSGLLSEKARQYRMYVAAGIVRKDEKAGRIYNTVLLYDRQGNLVGMYDKLHPYSPEVNEEGVTPGSAVPVFETDFGKVGVIICYDSWFTDVIQLEALKGAEMILFPSAGFYRSLMPARAADNGVRIVASAWGQYGMWDTAGRDVQNPNADTTVVFDPGQAFKDVTEARAGGIGILLAAFDMNFSPAPAYNGGTMSSAPAGKRNKGNQKLYLEEQIRKERERWWTE